MKVILLEDAKKLGKKGEIIEVNDGYARNCLIPKKICLEANSKNLNDLKLKAANDARIAAKQLEEARVFAEELNDKQVNVKIKIGDNGKVFGAVSSKEISDAAKEQLGMELDKKKMVLKDPIKETGIFKVPVKIHPQVTAELKVVVVEE